MAFATNEGIYEPLVMQFGMMNSPAVFQQAMNELFSGMLKKRVLVYLDDIIGEEGVRFVEHEDGKLSNELCFPR